MTDTPALLLASSSPFRRQLLDKLGLKFIHQSPDIDESRLAGEAPLELVMRLAREKAEALAELPDGRSPTARDWKRMSAKWRIHLNERINDLTVLRDQLNECIGCGCLSIKACRLRNPFDSLSEKGPGPHF